MIVDRNSYFERLEAARRDYHRTYLAMYSSVIDGIVTDPLLMSIPLDDHMVHRGDGVFEMLKCVDGGIYNFNAHLERLLSSAGAIGLRLPKSPADMRQTVLETLRAAGVRDGAVRIYLSRGPGSFGVNPYDSPASQLYVVVTTLSPSFMDLHPEGAVVIISTVPVKPSSFATMKNCNYLPNVMMKKEAVDAGADFAVGIDSNAFLTEGPTENIGLVTDNGDLVCPRLDNVLCGTTMRRVLELAQALVIDGTLRQVRYGNVTRDDMHRAREILIFGTTTDVTRVRRFDDREMPLDSPVFEALSRLLLNDIRSGVSHRTPIDE